YLTPYLGKDQVTSGTLAYALAMGRPVVSTPYIHAKEALADGVAGNLVPFRDPAAIAAALRDLLADPAELEARSKAVWQAARPATWAHNA
ncbi:glycosyltransferase, partial [Acinetobacter baumannii]